MPNGPTTRMRWRVGFTVPMRLVDTGGSIAKAFGLLEPALERFPTEPILYYNLACYLAQMGREEDAWNRFRQALEAGDPIEFRMMALADEDLKPIWPRIALMS